jgi:arsenite methyltransferase
MALTCPEGFDVERLRAQVRATYERVAAEPGGEFHFHRGGAYAAKFLNYAREDLARVPAVSAKRFSGVGNPHRTGPLRSGETVLDHACGAGMDLIIAARRVGPRGRAIGVDMTQPMLDHAWQGALAAQVDDWTSLFNGVFEDLPVDDASVDVVISNGVLNLAPDKRRVFAEIFRVLRPGGRLHLADVVVQRELDNDARGNPELWMACIGGALQEPELLELAASTGFAGRRVTERFDCFRETAAEHTVPKDLRIGAVNFFARKPGG